MVYEKKQQSRRGNKIVIAVVVLAVIGLIAGAVLWVMMGTDEASKATQPANTSSGEGGFVAFLGSSGSDSTAAQNSESSEPKREFSDLPHELALPAGWVATGAASPLPDPCNQEVIGSVTTYKNGNETITVHENTRPNGCDGSIIADVYLDFNYSKDGSSLVIDDSVVNQCTKEENPTCPKGDGNVSVFIGNESTEDPTKQLPNAITGKTYFFSITDSTPDTDLALQVQSLANLVELIAFK